VDVEKKIKLGIAIGQVMRQSFEDEGCGVREKACCEGEQLRREA